MCHLKNVNQFNEFNVAFMTISILQVDQKT